MRPCASWTAKMAVLTLTAGFAATVGGSAGVALAVDGVGLSQAAAAGGSAGDVCSNAGALLGIAGAACQTVAAAGWPATGTTGTAGTAGRAGQSAAASSSAPASPGNGQGAAQGTVQGSSPGQGIGATVSEVVRSAIAPVTAVLGASSTAPAVKTVPALAPLTAVTGASSPRKTGAGGAPAAGSTAGKAPAVRAGDTNVPAATQLAGLGALPGLADLPSAGLNGTPARQGNKGGGIPMPGTALSAASSGMSSDSFAALAVGALLAGASALKIASRRARDRKAGIGVAQ